jgi:hypothetical protein
MFSVIRYFEKDFNIERIAIYVTIQFQRGFPTIKEDKNKERRRLV